MSEHERYPERRCPWCRTNLIQNSQSGAVRLYCGVEKCVFAYTDTLIWANEHGKADGFTINLTEGAD